MRGIICRNASIGMMPKYFIASQPSLRSLPGSAGGGGCPLVSSAIGPYSYEKVLVDGGLITAADMRYHFFVTDHLGNVRVVVNDAGAVEQVILIINESISSNQNKGISTNALFCNYFG